MESSIKRITPDGVNWHVFDWPTQTGVCITCPHWDGWSNGAFGADATKGRSYLYVYGNSYSGRTAGEFWKSNDKGH